MDDADLAILQCLSTNARATLQEIAEELRMKRPTVHARVKALEGAGILHGYRAEIAPEETGAGLLAFVFLEVCHGKGQDCMTASARLATALRSIPQVTEVHTLAGDDDLMLKVRARDIKELQEVVTHRISGLAGVERLRTRIALSTHFERPPAVRMSLGDVRAPSRRSKTSR